MSSILDTVPLAYVTIQGTEAPADFTRSLISMEIDEHVHKATKITLVLLDETGAFRDGDVVREGDTVTVRWGYPGNLSRPRAGIVHKVEPSYSDDTVKIEAYGRELALSVGAIRRQFRGRTFRQAVTELATEANVTVSWQASTGITFDAQVIDDETVFGWIQRKTAELGLEMELQPGTNGANDTLVIREPALGVQAITVLHHQWRNAEILSFEVETHVKKHNRHRQDQGVVAVFVDPASGAVLQHAAGDPNTTRATLAARRVEAEANRLAGQNAAQVAGQAAFVAATPSMAGLTPAQQTAAYQASLTAPGASSRATDDNPDALVSLAADSFQQAMGYAPPSGAPSAADAAPVPVITAADSASAQQHVQQLAEGRFRRHDRGKVKAKIKTIGLPMLAKGKVVQVVGVAVRDAGLWYCRAVKHTIGTDYTVEIEGRREGVNGRHGRRPAAAAQQNTTDGATLSGQAEPVTTVNLANGAET